MNANGLLADLARLQRRALIVGAAALGLCLGGALISPAQFFHSYLLAFLFWVGLPLGCLGVLMLHHLAGGSWGYVIRRPLEAGTRTLPVFLLLFLPVLLGLRDLYPWARPEAVAADALLQHKSAYLNVPFFLGRAALYFALWFLLAYLLNRWSAEDDQSETPRHWRRFRTLSGPGLGLYGLTASFAAVDWMMSLEPHWFSTIYGMLFIVGQVLATLALMIVVLRRLARHEPVAEVVTPNHFHNLGNLMFAFVMLWAYMSFSQYLIIWSANLPEEIPWYLHRTGHGWQAVALVLIVFHFAVPFVLLLIRHNKRKPEILAGVALGLFVLRTVDLFWQVAPSFHGTSLRLHWMDPVAVIGVGGLWLAVFLWQLRQRPLLARHDPAIEGLLEEPAEA